jgi:hypothetical protein
MGANSGGILTFAYHGIVRGSTSIYSPSSVGLFSSSLGSNDINLIDRTSMMYVDSPNTTGATTYKLQVRSNGSPVSTSVSSGTITVMEVLV